MTTQAIQAIRGMNDICPEQIVYWQHVESVVKRILAQYHYSEIRLPILEKTALFTRTIGDATDIVEKEMYTFNDRNGDSLSLRPEGTACCVRAGIEQGLLYNQIQRLWYSGPMFRHERPQKGRYRQFYQLGVEAYGLPGPEVEVEQMALFWRLLQALGLSNQVTLQINTLGSTDCRQRYRERLVNFFQQHHDQLDDDAKLRLQKNPLRLLDSKQPAIQALINQAPVMADNLTEAAASHFKRCCHLLDQLQIPYQHNPRLVRGLDYYCHTVYEWTTDSLGAQGTVCAGGRYDGLVAELGGKSTPAVGFAMGFERMILMLQQYTELSSKPDIFMVLLGDDAMQHGLVLAEQLRTAHAHLRVLAQTSGASMKSQFKQADQSGAQWACVLGESECQQQTVTLKHLRDRSIAQRTLAWSELINFFKGDEA